MGPTDTLGQRLFQARTALQQRTGRAPTDEELGAAVDVTGVTYGRWQNDKREPTLDVIKRLAKVLGVNAGWLAVGEGPMFPEPAAPATPVAPVHGETRMDSPDWYERITPAVDAETPAHPRRKGRGNGGERAS